MKAIESRKIFRSLLRDEGLTQKTIDFDKSIKLMGKFFNEYSLDTPRECNDPDGLAFYYQTSNRRGATPFEVGLIRCFREQGSDLSGSRLRLTFNFPWYETVHQTGLAEKLKPTAPVGNKFCWHPEKFSDLEQHIKKHQVYLTIKNLKPKSVNVIYEDVWGIFW